MPGQDEQMPAGAPDSALQDLATGKIDANQAMAAQEQKAGKVPSSGAGREMPRYVSHKRVHALLIKSVDGHKLSFADAGYAPMEIDAEVFARYTPVPGDYYVVYADGYQSFSPGKAFLEGYTRLR